MLPYKQKLKPFSKELRSNMTDAERLLWSKLRRKQICGVQFYRQKPLEPFVVDFYAPKPGIVIELDDGQHYEEKHTVKDKNRDDYLNKMDLKVLRFNNLEVLQSTRAVLESIYDTVRHQLKSPARPSGDLPPLSKGANRN